MNCGNLELCVVPPEEHTLEKFIRTRVLKLKEAFKRVQKAQQKATAEVRRLYNKQVKVKTLNIETMQGQ